ncbi:DUF4135 domain-containing protein [Umezawaea endophytica]|uniref:DUF4135 domain-containing protein n=1 Tax=Umezawaea endophytica TaxID=1654476 RepID=A0A9X3ADC5_9PSEU|nr:DUF4135 domain-containing protein [Umezawaea endophytica]MCS7475531.1 DUF4135 domain-containing protein [Umezawaea endophytica]
MTTDPAGPLLGGAAELAAIEDAVRWGRATDWWPAPDAVVDGGAEPADPIVDLCGAEGDRPMGVLGLVFPAARAIRDAAVRDVRGLGLPGLARAVSAAVPLSSLHDVVVRAVVADLHAVRDAGGLGAGTSRGRFEEFCAGLATPAGRRAVWDRYPVLAGHVRGLCGRWHRSVVELASRLADDRPGSGEVRSLRLGAGDGHRGGRGVAIVGFEDGEVVYKPRPADADRAFAALVEWFNGTGPALELRCPGTRPGAGYAWVEFVEHRAGTDARAYHRRAGALLALLYAVLGTDMHQENVIARGDEPVPVDLEALCTPLARPADWSVARTGLLHTGGVDISGLGGGAPGPHPVPSPTVRDRGTDTMHLVWATGTRTTWLPNRQVVDGTRTRPADHVDSLVEGFAEAYDRLARSRKALLAPGGPVHALSTAALRVVLRPTTVYSRLLAERAHPAHLSSPQAQRDVLALLGSDAVATTEAAQLATGDVPLFEFTPTGRDLTAGNGTVLRNALPHQPYDAVRAVLDRLSDQDLTRQADLIRTAWQV